MKGTLVGHDMLAVKEWGLHSPVPSHFCKNHVTLFFEGHYSGFPNPENSSELEDKQLLCYGLRFNLLALNRSVY